MNNNNFLNNLRLGRPVEEQDIAHLTTPRIPDETWTIITKENGEFFKRYLEADKFLAFLDSVVINNLDTNSDINTKSVKDSPFVQQCELTARLLQKRLANNDSLGFVWSDSSHSQEDAYTYNGKDGKTNIHYPSTFSVALTPELAQKYLDTLHQISETSIIPIYSLNAPSYYVNFKELN